MLSGIDLRREVGYSWGSAESDRRAARGARPSTREHDGGGYPMAQTSSRKAQQRRRFQKRRQESRLRLRPTGKGAAAGRPAISQALAGTSFSPPPASSALSPEVPGLNGPYDPARPTDPLDPLVPTGVDDGTRLG